MLRLTFSALAGAGPLAVVAGQLLIGQPAIVKGRTLLMKPSLRTFALSGLSCDPRLLFSCLGSPRPGRGLLAMLADGLLAHPLELALLGALTCASASPRQHEHKQSN